MEEETEGWRAEPRSIPNTCVLPPASCCLLILVPASSMEFYFVFILSPQVRQGQTEMKPMEPSPPVANPQGPWEERTGFVHWVQRPRLWAARGDDMGSSVFPLCVCLWGPLPLPG